MMNLTMMSLTPGPLVSALLFFALMIPLVMLVNLLVVSVAWGLVFLYRQESSQLVTLFRCLCYY